MRVVCLTVLRGARADMRERHVSPRGRLTVGLPPRVGHTITTDLVQSFRHQFPDAAISVAEGLSASLREWLIAGRLDVAVLFDPPHSPQLMVETLLREVVGVDFLACVAKKNQIGRHHSL